MDRDVEHLGEVHEEAMKWVWKNICHDEYDILWNCYAKRKDCTFEREVWRSCTAKNEVEALMRLQYNAKVQCPSQFTAYTNCMDSLKPGEKIENCASVWYDMQRCAAKQVIDHVNVQKKRKDGVFTPPQFVDPDIPGRG
jgi:hypothetical protein